MANFLPKPWTNPTQKITIFRLFKLLVFIAYSLFFLTSCFYSLEKHFIVVEYRKTHFSGLYYL